MKNNVFPMKNRDTNIEVNSVACAEVSSASQIHLRGAPAPLDLYFSDTFNFNLFPHEAK